MSGTMSRYLMLLLKKDCAEIIDLPCSVCFLFAEWLRVCSLGLNFYIPGQDVLSCRNLPVKLLPNLSFKLFIDNYIATANGLTMLHNYQN